MIGLDHYHTVHTSLSSGSSYAVLMLVFGTNVSVT